MLIKSPGVGSGADSDASISQDGESAHGEQPGPNPDEDIQGRESESEGTTEGVPHHVVFPPQRRQRNRRSPLESPRISSCIQARSDPRNLLALCSSEKDGAPGRQVREVWPLSIERSPLFCIFTQSILAESSGLTKTGCRDSFRSGEHDATKKPATPANDYAFERVEGAELHSDARERMNHPGSTVAALDQYDGSNSVSSRKYLIGRAGVVRLARSQDARTENRFNRGFQRIYTRNRRCEGSGFGALHFYRFLM